MSQIIHDVSFPNDGNGDELRTAFVNQNTMNTELYTTKVDKVVGKELSTNDYTNAEKSKLAGIASGAEVNVQADWNQNDNSQADYIKNKPTQMFASVGYFDHNDLATHTTPIALTSGVNAKLTNDALGVFTDFTQAPYGISNIWDTTTNQFDFSSLDIGDTLDLRVDCLLTTTGTNKTYKIFLKLGIGTPSEYVILVGTGELKSAVTNEPIVKEASFYIGSLNVQTAPAELYIVVDTSGSVKVNGWYTRILRKSVNIVGIEGDDLKQDVLTETNFGAFANGLTTEDAIVDGDLINFTDVSDTNKQKKTTWLNIKAKLKTYLDTFYQVVLVSGTNIKTINGNSILGGGDLVVSGGGTTDTIAQASWEDNIFNASNQVVGSLNGYAANGGNINNGLASPNIDDYMNFLCFSSGTSANGGYRYLQISPVGGSSFKPQAGLTFFGTFCIYSNSSADTLIRLGFNSSSNMPTDAQFGAYLEITASSIVGKTANNNVRSSTTSGSLTYSTAQGSEIPYHFMIHFDTLTQVTFKVVKHDGTVVLNTSLNTNTPPAAARFYASAMGCIQTAGTNRNILGLSRLGFGVQKPNFLNSF